MKYLVTGAAGFVGNEVCKQLIRVGNQVCGVVRSGHLASTQYVNDLWATDIRDPNGIADVIGRAAPDVVIHLAAVSVVGAAEDAAYSCLLSNVIGTHNVTVAAKKAGARCVVSTSDKAYGSHSGSTGTDAPLKPTGVYETSKACADYVARMNGATVVRCCNVYGPGDMNRSRLVPRTCERLLSGQPPAIHGGASAFMREWITVEDAASAYIAIASPENSDEAYNVHGVPARVGDVAKILSDIAGGELTPYEEMPVSYYEIPEQRLERTPINGWELRRWGLCEELERTFLWYKENLPCASS